MFPNRIRYFNKYILNRLIGKSAGSAHSHFALVRHTGRRSGKSYETPIIVMPTGEDFMIALTYGPKVDWYRNLVATGQGTLLWQGRSYTIGKPEPVDQTSALQAFSALERPILRLFNVQHFARVKSIASESASVQET
ncbi:MAG TPA: nitroreductase family deazaflavin-dependent oxidoreductase [Ktedonobacteraceae bacterium]|jgi:deazaflavin-dependent oxidoreductase (nitroreductase family)|nr:nitroreductase family deazaflavin-dependent oxidoreductase [Ktedonobacteraceae bacterium]